MKYVVLNLLLLSSGLVLGQNKEIVRLKGAPANAYPFSLGVISNGTLYVAGQVGTEPQTTKLVPGGIEAETAQTIRNIQAILEAAGATLDDVVNVTVYLSNLDDFPKMNAVYQQFFKAGNYPARTTVGVAKLVFGASIEMSMTAAVPKKR